MNSKDKNIIPTPEQLGIPSGGYDPMKNITIEGDFYRGLVKNESKPFIVRICSIMFGLFNISIALLIFGIIY